MGEGGSVCLLQELKAATLASRSRTLAALASAGAGAGAVLTVAILARSAFTLRSKSAPWAN